MKRNRFELSKTQIKKEITIRKKFSNKLLLEDYISIRMAKSMYGTKAINQICEIIEKELHKRLNGWIED